MALEEILGRLLPLVRAQVLTCHAANSCIASVRTLLYALEDLEVPARPLGVRAQVYNTAFARCVERAGRLPLSREEVDQWTEEHGAWSVGIGYDPPEGRAPGDAGLHLVAVVGAAIAPQYLADPSLDQASRPARGIVLAPAHWTLPAGDWHTPGHLALLYHQPDGRHPCVVHYEWDPPIRAGRWEQSPNWHSARCRTLARQARLLLAQEVLDDAVAEEG